MLRILCELGQKERTSGILTLAPKTSVKCHFLCFQFCFLLLLAFWSQDTENYFCCPICTKWQTPHAVVQVQVVYLCTGHTGFWRLQKQQRTDNGLLCCSFFRICFVGNNSRGKPNRKKVTKCTIIPKKKRYLLTSRSFCRMCLGKNSSGKANRTMVIP